MEVFLKKLKKNYEFARVFRHGKRYVGKHLSIHFRKNGISENRYGFTTVKHFGNAVQRNRMRRLQKEALRYLAPSLILGYDIIIMGRQLDNTTNFHTIRAELETLFYKAKLLKEVRD